MNKSELVAAVAASAGVSQGQAQKIIEVTHDTIAEVLKAGEEVRLAGFGTYSIKQKAQREGRNPSTGERITIAARKAVSFKPTRELADGVNRP